MSISVAERRRLSQASVGLVILGLHLAGILVWWTAERYSMRIALVDTPRQTISIWLPSLPVPESEQGHKPKHAQDPAVAVRKSDTKEPLEPSHTADTTTAPTASGMSSPSAEISPNEAQTPGVPPLNLNLSRRDISSAAPRNFAEQSPFRGRLPNTVERQITSAAAETGPWTEERIDNDRIRFRRGNTCVMVQRPRAAIIDPISEAAGSIPWRGSKPEVCND